MTPTGRGKPGHWNPQTPLPWEETLRVPCDSGQGRVQDGEARHQACPLDLEDNWDREGR